MGNQSKQHQRPAASPAPIPAIPGLDIPPRCGECLCFAPPPDMPEGADAVAWAQSRKDLGTCRRFPTPVAKRTDDYCFEFIAKGLPHA